jgi:hypothetical protein
MASFRLYDRPETGDVAVDRKTCAPIDEALLFAINATGVQSKWI